MKAKAIKKARDRALKERENRIKKSEDSAAKRRKLEVENRERQKRKFINALKAGKVKLKPRSPEPNQPIFAHKKIMRTEVILDLQTTPNKSNSEYRLDGDTKWI
ncbi:hypothetical protein [Pseudomonas chlororaphis]|uniref:hypothetical protein n=1 Tax=Pseudomonas chlororaphis TaxID=587753 RepID=UPI00026E5176|nr:hypothetical protein [Pseudomonas chlororaphis]EJK99590.1 hypothetical protein Pchl3084_4777 [Pseudomonas chlororaphis subsp. aureofaciens 30-84]